LHAALENLQQKLSRQPTQDRAASSAPASVGVSPLLTPSNGNPTFGSPAPGNGAFPLRQPVPPSANPTGAAPRGSVIPLTPLDESH
jgi:hypothetical protein